MSNRTVRPSQRLSERRMRRLKFRPVVEIAESSETLNVPDSAPARGKQRSEYLVPPKLQLKSRSIDTLSPVVDEPEDTGALFSQAQDIAQRDTPASSLSAVSKRDADVDTALLEALEQTDGVETKPVDVILPDEIQSLSFQSGDVPVDKVKTTRLQAIVNSLPGISLSGDDQSKKELSDILDSFSKQDTLPMMVLKGISKQEGQAEPEMKSEVSGAAGAAGLVGVGNIIGSVLRFLGNFLIQYGFGRELYGLYTLATSIISLVASVFNLGLDDAMVRYISIYRSKQNPTSLRGLTVFCTALAGLAGIVGSIVVLFFTPSLISLTTGSHNQGGQTSLVQVIPLVQMLAPMIPLLCMQVVWISGLQGFKAFKWRVLSMNIAQPILMILLVGFVLVFAHNIVGIAVALLVSTASTLVMNMFFLFKQMARLPASGEGEYEVREWLSFATLNFLTTIIDTVLDSIDTLLLAIFGVSEGQLGLYGSAVKMSAFISMPLTSINSMFAPTIAELHSKDEKQKLEDMFKIVTKWTIVFSLPIFLVMVLFAPYILALSGPSFVAAWPLVVAFSLGSLVNAGTGAVGYMLLMTGKQKLSFINSLVAVATNLILGIILTPRYGAMGTAISTGTALAVVNLLRLLQVRILLKMQPYRWDVFKPVAAGVLSSAIIGAIFYIITISHIPSYIIVGHAIISLQLLFIPVFLAIYAGFVMLFRGGTEDEIVLSALRKKILRGRGKKK